jgi:hypothetical protein
MAPASAGNASMATFIVAGTLMTAVISLAAGTLVLLSLNVPQPENQRTIKAGVLRARAQLLNTAILQTAISSVNFKMATRPRRCSRRSCRSTTATH